MIIILILTIQLPFQEPNLEVPTKQKESFQGEVSGDISPSSMNLKWQFNNIDYHY